MERFFQDRLAVIFIALFCLILYFNSLWNTFIFDDLHSIVRNLYIKNLRYIPLFFKGYYTSEAFIPKGMFRPLLLLTLSFNYLFSGLQPLGYHLINILLHFLNGILFYCLLRILKKDLSFGLSLIISLLFIAHPINTETVNYISCRSDLLVSLFILLAFFSYAKGRFLLLLFLYILALLSKETALVFPFLVFAYNFIFPKDDRAFLKIKKSLFVFYLLLIGITILYWVYRQSLFGSSGNILTPLSSPIRSFYSNLLTQSAVTIFYLRLFFWPHPLTIHHNFPTMDSLFHPLAFISVLTIIIMIVLIFFLRKRQPLMSLGLVWYLVCLIPKFYAVLNAVAAEHHFYLPSFGIYLIIAVISQNLYLKFRRQFIIVAIGMMCIFTILVWFRNYEWRDSFILWQKATQRAPESGYAHQSLGVEYMKRQEYEQAERELRKALVYSTQIPSLYINNWIVLAKISQIQKRYDEAKSFLNKALEINSRDYRVHRALGDLYKNTGEYEKAEVVWKQCLAFHPHASDIKIKLGALYLEKQDLKQARNYFLGAIESNPDSFLAFFDLGIILERERDLEGALKAYQKSIRLNPAYAPGHYHLGSLYAEKADPRALRHLKEAVRLAPYFAEAHNNLAVLYASMEPPKLELARHHAQKALSLGYSLNPEFLKLIGLSQLENPKK